MAEKSTGAEALLAGMADEMAALVRAHFDALKETPVVADTFHSFLVSPGTRWRTGSRRLPAPRWFA